MTRSHLAQSTGWVLTIAGFYLLISLAQLESRGTDSSLYVAIAHSLENRPLAEWIAPHWPEGRARTGLFREHTAAFFWPAAGLGHLGLSHAALLCNFLWYLALLATTVALGRGLLGGSRGWLVGVLWLISPLGLQYLLRFNHEPAWAFATVGGLWCLSAPGIGRRRGAGLVALLVLGCAVKGALGLLALPLWAAWAARRRLLSAFLPWAAVALAAVALLAALYEHSYRQATGEGFLAAYLRIQGGYVGQAEQAGWGHKLLTPPYYLVYAVYFALPSSLILGWDLLRRRRGRFDDAQWLGLVGGGGWVLALSFMSRRAVRYAFPAFPLFHLAGAEALARRWPALLARLERCQPAAPYLVMLWLLGVAALRAFVEPGWYRFINPL